MDPPRSLFTETDSTSYVVPLNLHSPQSSTSFAAKPRSPHTSILGNNHVFLPSTHPIAHFLSAIDGTQYEYNHILSELQQYKQLSEYQQTVFIRSLRWTTSKEGHWHPKEEDKSLCTQLLYSNNLQGQIGLSNISRMTVPIRCTSTAQDIPANLGRQRNDFLLVRKFISQHLNTSSYISKRITYVQCQIQYLQDVQSMQYLKQRSLFADSNSNDVFWVPDYCDVYNDLQANMNGPNTTTAPSSSKGDVASHIGAKKNSVINWFKSIGKKESSPVATPVIPENNTTPPLYVEAARVTGFIDGYCVTRGMDCVPKTAIQVDYLLAYAVSIRGGAGVTLLDQEYLTLPHQPNYFFQQPVLPIFPSPTSGNASDRTLLNRLILTLAILPLASEEQIQASKEWVDALEHVSAMSSASDEQLSISTEYLFLLPSYIPIPTALGAQRQSTKDYMYPLHASKYNGVCEEVLKCRPEAPELSEITDLSVNLFNMGTLQCATLLHQVQDQKLPPSLLTRQPSEQQIPISLLDSLYHFLLGGCVQVHGQQNVQTLRGVFGNHAQVEALVPLCYEMRNAILRPNYLEKGQEHFLINVQTQMTSLCTALGILGFTSSSPEILLFAIQMLIGRISAYVHEAMFQSNTHEAVATKVQMSPIASYAKENSLKMLGTPRLDRKGSSNPRETAFFSPHSQSRHHPLSSMSSPSPIPMLSSSRTDSYMSNSTPLGSINNSSHINNTSNSNNNNNNNNNSNMNNNSNSNVHRHQKNYENSLSSLHEAVKKDNLWKKDASLHSMETQESLEVDAFLIPLDKYSEWYKYIPDGYLPSFPYESSIRVLNLMSQSEYATVQCIYKTLTSPEPTLVNTTLQQACRVDPASQLLPSSNIYSGIEFTYLVLLTIRCLHFEADRVAKVNKLIDKFTQSPHLYLPPEQWTQDYIDQIQAPSINADNLFPLVLYTISQANISQPHYYLWLCKEQLSTNITELGETGISNSLFEAAVMHLMNNTAASLTQNLPICNSTQHITLTLPTKHQEIQSKDIYDIDSLSLSLSEE